MVSHGYLMRRPQIVDSVVLLDDRDLWQCFMYGFNLEPLRSVASRIVDVRCTSALEGPISHMISSTLTRLH